jgi:hypothetical protein
MEYKFDYKVRALVTFDVFDFDIIWEGATKNYDGVVRDETKTGGYIFGMRNRQIFAETNNKPSFQVCLSFAEIDIICKALEMSQHLKRHLMKRQLHEIMNAINERSNELNK